MGRVLDRVALCGLMQVVAHVFSVEREKVDIVGSKLIYLGKLRANAQAWSGGSTWNAVVREICHSALQLPLPKISEAESLMI